MYFGSAQPLNRDYLRRIKELTKRTKTPWLSDHLCRGSVDGRYIRVSRGAVIVRQRPGTALGFIFLSLEDETGISNAIIHFSLHERQRVAVTRGKFLRVDGTLQNQEGVI